MQFALFLVTILSHVFLWIGIINRLHSTAIPRRLVFALSLICSALIGIVPILAVWWWFAGGKNFPGQINWQTTLQPGWLAFFLYVVFCWSAGAATFVRWICYRCLRRPPELLRFHRRRDILIAPAAAAMTAEEHAHHISVHLPGNESLRLDLTERAMEVPRLPRPLDGLTILHISDLHFTGMVGKAYFREVVRAGNELKPDLAAVTGDLVDKTGCISWIPDTLGQLTARYGVYVILGNHDLHVDEIALRKTLADSGLIGLGGRWMRIEIRGQTVIMAGNELPWYAPAADLENCPPRTPDCGQLRIALSHSPDQLDWARTNDVDLMLSGHTHGGQIRIPLLGPVFLPSASGVKYDYGVFHAPPTILHVTRGISGRQPLRWNCVPEIALLTLHTPR
jgi:predicted MPP superfamily phosphohydrolase